MEKPMGLDIQKVMDEGAALKKLFGEAQDAKQATDAAYAEVKAAYSGWTSKYSHLAKAIDQTVGEDDDS